MSQTAVSRPAGGEDVLGKAYDARLMARLWPFVRPHWALAAVTFLLIPVTIAFEPLPVIRLAEPFEALRDRSDTILAATGARPRVFLAALGDPSEFMARTTLARNFFASGGIEAVGGELAAGGADIVAAFQASGARLACLCSSDEVYAREGIEAAAALRGVGERRH